MIRWIFLILLLACANPVESEYSEPHSSNEFSIATSAWSMWDGTSNPPRYQLVGAATVYRTYKVTSDSIMVMMDVYNMDGARIVGIVSRKSQKLRIIPEPYAYAKTHVDSFWFDELYSYNQLKDLRFSFRIEPL